MKKLMMVVVVLLLGVVTMSLDYSGYYPGVRLYYDYDGDGYHSRTSQPAGPWGYANMLAHGYYKLTTLGRESGVMDQSQHIHP